MLQTNTSCPVSEARFNLDGYRATGPEREKRASLTFWDEVILPEGAHEAMKPRWTIYDRYENQKMEVLA